MISSTGSPPWLMSWSVSKLTCSSCPRRPRPSRQEHDQNDPHRFYRGLILLRLGWLIAWRGPGETSRGSPPLRRCWRQTTGVTQGNRSQALPRCSTVESQNPGSAQQWKESQLPARELGLQLHSMEVSSADKYEGAFKEATKARSAALAVTRARWLNSNQKRIADLATKNRLPAIYPRGDFVDSGGLMSYGPDRAEPFGAPPFMWTRS